MLRRRPGPPIIEVKEIGKRYGNVIALSDVTTSVKAGEVTCVLGDNGAGKSTFIKILAGAHEHTDGELLIDGVARQLAQPAVGAEPRASPRSTRTSRWSR